MISKSFNSWAAFQKWLNENRPNGVDGGDLPKKYETSVIQPVAAQGPKVATFVADLGKKKGVKDVTINVDYSENKREGGKGTYAIASSAHLRYPGGAAIDLIKDGKGINAPQFPKL